MPKQETEQEKYTTQWHNYFWTNIPGKTQCGKTSAEALRVLLLCSSKSEYNSLEAQLAIQYKEKLDKINSEMISPCHWKNLTLISLEGGFVSLLLQPLHRSLSTLRSLYVTSTRDYAALPLNPLLPKKLNFQPPGLTPRLLTSETQFPQQEFDLPLGSALPLPQLCMGQR